MAQQLKISLTILFQVYSCSHKFHATKSYRAKAVHKGIVKGEKVIKVLMALMV